MTAILEREGPELDPLRIDRADEVTWSDASLGCPRPGLAYAQMLTPGLRLVLTYRGQALDYRTAGTRALLCTQPQRNEPLESIPLPGLWTTLAPMPTVRTEVAVAELDGKIYVIGGFGTIFAANDRYDPQTDTWTRLRPVPRTLNHTSAVVLEDLISM